MSILDMWEGATILKQLVKTDGKDQEPGEPSKIDDREASRQHLRSLFY